MKCSWTHNHNEYTIDIGLEYDLNPQIVELFIKKLSAGDLHKLSSFFNLLTVKQIQGLLLGLEITELPLIDLHRFTQFAPPPPKPLSLSLLEFVKKISGDAEGKSAAIEAFLIKTKEILEEYRLFLKGMGSIARGIIEEAAIIQLPQEMIQYVLLLASPEQCTEKMIKDYLHSCLTLTSEKEKQADSSKSSRQFCFYNFSISNEPSKAPKNVKSINAGVGPVCYELTDDELYADNEDLYSNAM